MQQRDRVIVYTDGGARGNPGEAGAGAFIEGPNPVRLYRYLGTTTNNEAEYQALILALRHLVADGVRVVELRSDSELMVNQLNGRYKVKALHLKPLWAEAKALLERFDTVSIRAIPREQNREADQLANLAIDTRSRGVL